MRATTNFRRGRVMAWSLGAAILSLAVSTPTSANEFQAPPAGLRVTYDVKSEPATLCASRPQFIYTVTESKNHHAIVDLTVRCGDRAGKVEMGYDRIEFYRSIHWLKKRFVMGGARLPASRFESRETIDASIRELDLFRPTTQPRHVLPAVRVKFENVEADGATHEADMPLVGTRTSEIVGREKLRVGAQALDTIHVRIRTELHRDASEIAEDRREEFKKVTKVEMTEEYWYAPKIRFWIEMHSAKVAARGETEQVTLTAREIRTR